MEQLKYTFDQVNEWIRVADQKALILGSFNIAGLIYQLINFSNFRHAHGCINPLLLISLVLTFTALFLWLRIIYPRLDNTHKKSKIFFQHIANAYGEDRDSGIKDLQSFSKEEFERDLASQIIANSVVAKRKYLYIQRFMWVFGLQLLSMGILFISLLR